MLALADTSAWAWRRRTPDEGAEFDGRVVQGKVVICDMVKLELLQVARNGTEFDLRRSELDGLPHQPIGPAEWERALEVYGRLAHQGGAHQRSVGHPDLLIAAAAESAGAELVHYDEDFDRIAAVTGQPTRWLAPRGTL